MKLHSRFFRLLPFALLPLSLIAAEPAATPYGLSGIVTVNPEAKITRPELANADALAIDETSYRAAIATARVLYSSDGSALRSVLEARNRYQLSTPVIVYMGGFTSNGDDVQTLEHHFRTGIAMTPVAELGANVDPSTTQLILRNPVEGELAVKASTADFSDTRDSKKFCFWLRIDDELMKVTAVDAKSGTITVVRGFSESNAAAHTAGAKTLSPVYVGNRDQLGAARHSNSWPAGPDYLRYAVDPRQSDAARFKAGLVTKVMKDGYDGAWFDTFQPVPYNLCDALGRKVAYFWDFGTKQLYDFNSYLDAIKTYIRNVRQTVHAAVGHEPVLYANSATASYARGVKTLFNQGSTHDLMDGYCFEDSYLKVRATREKGKGTATKAEFEPITGAKWLFNATNHADAASSGLTGICMAGPAGYLAAYFNPARTNYAQLLRYAYGSYLLTVTSARTTSFGLPLLISPEPSTARAEAWPAVLFAAIGEPQQENNIAALKRADSGCYVREFSRGLVIVNSSDDTAPKSVKVPAGYVDATTAQPVTSLTLGSADAAILLRHD